MVCARPRCVLRCLQGADGVRPVQEGSQLRLFLPQGEHSPSVHEQNPAAPKPLGVGMQLLRQATEGLPRIRGIQHDTRFLCHGDDGLQLGLCALGVPNACVQERRRVMETRVRTARCTRAPLGTNPSR